MSYLDCLHLRRHSRLRMPPRGWRRRWATGPRTPPCCATPVLHDDGHTLDGYPADDSVPAATPEPQPAPEGVVQQVIAEL